MPKFSHTNMCNKLAASIALLLLTVTAASAQEHVNISTACSYFGESLPSSILTNKADIEADRLIQQIVAASGLAQNFEVRTAPVPNAAAVILGEKRLILYNREFIRRIAAASRSRWAAMSILAHEVGHHLNGHTIRSSGSRPKLELEADYFSGFLLQRLGARMKDATAVMGIIPGNFATTTHPDKYRRLAAIRRGWVKACRADSDCSIELQEQSPNGSEVIVDSENGTDLPPSSTADREKKKRTLLQIIR